MFEEMPFWGETVEEINQQIANKELNFDGKEVSEEFKAMLRALLNKNPDERPSIREAKAQFPWLQRPEFPSEQPPPDDDADNNEEEKKDDDGFD